MPPTKERGRHAKHDASCYVSICKDALADLEAERAALRDRLELIARNAESWHHDADAKQRALNVIAAWARGNEIPAALLDSLERPE